jgi:glycerol-3-phosphate dehydrogenase
MLTFQSPGIRPLVRDPKAKNTESLVRNHLVVVSDSGLLTCAGGKWTTYRQMAEDAVDEAIKVFDLTPGASASATLPATSVTDLDLHNAAACQTHHVRLIGAHGYTDELPNQLATTFNLDKDIAENLANNYGDRAWEVLSSGNNDRLISSLPYIEAEIRYGARHELAQTAADVLARRMRMAFLDVQAALDTLPRVVDVMAEEHNWSAERKNVEWKETVKFLGSMGLARELLGLTREEVVAGKHRERRWKSGERAGAAAPSGSGKLPVGLPAASLAKMTADKLGKSEEN